MLQEIFISFKENFNQKTRTPFFGAFIIVWSLRHWELLYTLFNFDSDDLRAEKIELIKRYFELNNFYIELIICLGWTIVSIISSYSFMNISKGITNVFEKYVTPFIYKITDSSKIVTKEELLKEKRRSDGIQEKYEKERKQRFEIQRVLEEIEQKLEESEKKSSDEGLSPENKEKLRRLQESIDESLNKIDYKEEKIEDEITDFNKLFFEKLKKEDLLKYYGNLIEEIKSDTFSFSKNSLASEALILGLIEQYEIKGSAHIKDYRFTQKGESFNQYYSYEMLRINNIESLRSERLKK